MESRFKSIFGRRLLPQIIVGICWIAASCGGLVLLAMYAGAPGSSQHVAEQFPIDSKIQLSQRGPTLIFFAHPQCPCTRASIGELEKIVASYQSSVTTWVVFFKPIGSDEAWDQTDLRRTAAAIPGAHVISDPGGAEARRFHATTSGETLLYSDQGKLLFNGGITSARGHAGDNAGRDAIESCLANSVPAHRNTPVFGCPIALVPEQK